MPETENSSPGGANVRIVVIDDLKRAKLLNGTGAESNDRQYKAPNTRLSRVPMRHMVQVSGLLEPGIDMIDEDIGKLLCPGDCPEHTALLLVLFHHNKMGRSAVIVYQDGVAVTTAIQLYHGRSRHDGSNSLNIQRVDPGVIEGTSMANALKVAVYIGYRESRYKPTSVEGKMEKCIMSTAAEARLATRALRERILQGKSMDDDLDTQLSALEKACADEVAEARMRHAVLIDEIRSALPSGSVGTP